MRKKTRKLTAWDLVAIEYALAAYLAASGPVHKPSVQTLLDKVRRASTGSLQVTIPQTED